MRLLLKATKHWLAKWRNGQANITFQEKIWLAQALVVLLVATDMRETSTATDTAKALLLRSNTHGHTSKPDLLWPWTFGNFLCYVGRDLTASGHLRRCIRHLLRRLFVGNGVPSSVYEMGLFVAAPSNTKFMHGDSESHKSVSDLISDGIRRELNTVAQFGRHTSSVEFIRKWAITITTEELVRRVDFATCQDLDGIFPERPLESNAWYAMLEKEKNGLPAKYLNDDWPIERSKSQKSIADAEGDPVEFGRRRLADSRETRRAIALAMFNCLFVGWLEQQKLN
ncbi:hypothetical protein QBC37DRAFT_461298 [Rhypophila decipiens]|uniref:Uncharacterized protein n=1 Tax=Rhypophila decipiens TaxID=261697 RepID=A0AAN6XSE3_9PEZI|nr:hypothetical protein QBC37DRAFT_461298 [Rhypophila decipiens]